MSAPVKRMCELGNFRLKLPLKRLELRQKAAKPTPDTQVKVNVSASHESPGMELDLRGERVEEGLDKLERYLDNAALARLPWVRIIHGKGTGAIRDAVRKNLKQHPLVRETRSGDLGEGVMGSRWRNW